MWWLWVALAAADDFDAAIACPPCDGWNEATPPFRVWGDTWYVGTRGLSSVLIRTPDGAILLDGGLPQSAPAIEASLAELGVELAEIRAIAVSHAHYDHVGGVAALQRHTGATVLASPAAAAALEAGGALPDDPQHGFGAEENAFPPVANVRAVADGEAISIGGVTLTAHHTPGHTPGGVSWSWTSCQEGRCLDVVYADSLNAVSAPGFRFTGGPADVLRASIDTVARLPCDVVVAVHPDFTDTFGKQASDEADRFVDPRGCRAYARGAAARLRERLATERDSRPAR